MRKEPSEAKETVVVMCGCFSPIIVREVFRDEFDVYGGVNLDAIASLSICNSVAFVCVMAGDWMGVDPDPHSPPVTEKGGGRLDVGITLSAFL